MEPQIRYVRSADGTRIATATLGQGRPLVIVNNYYVTIEILWEIPEAVENVERLSQERTVVLYDARGVGLSAQRIADFSLDASVSDLAAVIDSLASPTVDVTCSGRTTAIGITYTVGHPEKVRRLVLQSPRASGRVTDTDQRRRILRELASVDWEFYLQCIALLNFGWTDVGRRVAEKQAKEAKRGVWARAAEEWDRHDVSSLVAQVKCPTLVLDQRPRAGIVAITAGSQSSEIAAVMPNARLTRYDEDHGWLLARQLGLVSADRRGVFG